MSILLTKKCYETLTNKLHELKYKEIPNISEHIDECRTIGSLDDNPEYYSALESLDQANKKIDDIVAVLNNSVIFNETMIIKDTVSFGSTVTFVNTETNKEKTYTLVSVYESDVSNGLISIDSPFAKEMIGLHCGNEFYFNDNSYIITSINYSYL